jgi:hypothetical protein
LLMFTLLSYFNYPTQQHLTPHHLSLYNIVN